MKLEKITARYGDLTVLKDFSLELPDSGIICFFAPSGTGKTTLLNLLCGLMQPESGQILGLEHKKFAFVFQEDRLIPSLSARDNVGLVLNREHQSLAARYLSELGLSDWETATPAQLSGGMQRRVAIARAFTYAEQCGKQAVYLLDEPLKGLDEKTAQQTLRLIRRWVGGQLAFFITHDRNQARQIADLIVSFDGRPMQVVQIEQNIPQI